MRKFIVSFHLRIFALESNLLNLMPQIYREPLAITGPAFRPDTSIATVSHFDPDHDHSTFEMLANNYVCGGKEFGELCEINAEVS